MFGPRRDAAPGSNMKFWRGFFWVAAAFNVFGGLMGWFNFEKQLTDAGFPAPNYPFFAQLLFLAVIIFGIGYAMVAVDPLRNRNIVWLGLLAKIAGVAMTYWAVDQGQVPKDPFAIQPLFADVPWAILFAIFLWKTRGSRPTP
jgi:hypothetical protein